MSTSIDHLLPAADQAVRCAEHAREIDVDPGGTAIRAELVVLVETPVPWSKPALAHPFPAAMAAGLADIGRPVRVLATTPAHRTDRTDGAGIGVTVYERRAGSAWRRCYRVPDEDGLGPLAADLANPDRAREADRPVAVGGWLVADDAVAPPSVLICTQGSHDVCCGSEGARLALALEAAGLDIDVHRVSHTGGHRFAPTAMTLPDGRMWAGLDVAMVTTILAAGSDGAEPPVERCRGWWGADTGPAQVAERAVLAEIGWALDPADRRIVAGPAVERARGGPVIECRVEAGDRRWLVTVAEGRTVPTIACREPGGLPAKPALEYRVLGVAEY